MGKGARRFLGSRDAPGGCASKSPDRRQTQMTFVYDAAVLVAADRGVRRIWAEHKSRLRRGARPLVPAAVVAQVSRSARQVQLRRFLDGCIVVPLDADSAHEAGR